MNPFGWPQGLPLLALAPLVAILLSSRARARRRRLEGLTGPRWDALRVHAHPAGPGRSRHLFSAALLFALLALLQPRWGRLSGAEETRRLDLLVCLDVSRSMLARDLRPSRLERAQAEIRALSETASQDRFGLVCFAGDARLAVPLTDDRRTYAGLVALAGPASVSRGGTDLGAALEKAMEALEGRGDAAAVILLSDGEDLEQRGREAAARCREQGVVVHAVGLGSARGSKIAIEAAGGEAFLRGPDGAEVVSSLDAAGLRAVAEATGGLYLDAGDERQPLQALYERALRPLAASAPAAEQEREPVERYQWPLLAAFLLWILELAWTGRSRR